jgi:ABC-type transport system involved in multi-copper enzyme maturation permease subunit
MIYTQLIPNSGYVVIAEVFLGLMTLYTYRHTRGKGVAQQLIGAFSVNLIYTGALFIGLLFTLKLL